ncbi:ATP-binding protein [Bifidobacterium subtile]|jgi:SpoVK/Ycf46/Vps4 family AAA+-type ATPase|uniref:ATP-binding protein n=1 Tax=Bifidobacterium subtile TaxID=77635 RepID=UPI002F35D910
MAETNALIVGLRTAVAAAPENGAVRVALARALQQAGNADEARIEAATAFALNPELQAAADLIVELNTSNGADGTTTPHVSRQDVSEPTTQPAAEPASESPTASQPPTASVSDQGASAQSSSAEVAQTPARQVPPEFDWAKAEQEIDSEIGPAFLASETDDSEAPIPYAADLKREQLTLAQVAGLDQVKKRIQQTFLDPIRNPRIARMFGRKVGSGLLLYGPPGCGKTFVARAIAGELGATFMPISLADVLSKWIGESEKGVAAAFEAARAHTPAVLFFDEVDAIGGKRSSYAGSGLRPVVNQLLTEMDGVVASNDGVFVLAATNAPWDVDSALQRPGRFDRVLLVTPPDAAAREQIVRTALAQVPVNKIDVKKIALRFEGFSGADVSELCSTATQSAMADSIRTNVIRLVDMNDFELAFNEVHSSIGPWMQSARNVVEYANPNGQYDDLDKLVRSWKTR